MRLTGNVLPSHLGVPIMPPVGCAAQEGEASTFTFTIRKAQTLKKRTLGGDHHGLLAGATNSGDGRFFTAEINQHLGPLWGAADGHVMQLYQPGRREDGEGVPGPNRPQASNHFLLPLCHNLTCMVGVCALN